MDILQIWLFFCKQKRASLKSLKLFITLTYFSRKGHYQENPVLYLNHSLKVTVIKLESKVLGRGRSCNKSPALNVPAKGVFFLSSRLPLVRPVCHLYVSRCKLEAAAAFFCCRNVLLIHTTRWPHKHTTWRRGVIKKYKFYLFIFNFFQRPVFFINKI